ncbi:receptor-like protein Cf-9 homolog [Lycium ferocissimum]|uniref:receptor-like protein Cf-9 homolog n=1 Tax=Lycium ferocissimum TaxID=112874 RepID=UPI00281623CF|nr:receptor-like protein Cf-9 homolog [Lycium ferocissimum]
MSGNYQLGGFFPTTIWNSSASLMQLDLSKVNFSGNLPESLGYLTSLQSLTLFFCNLLGPIPKSLWNLTRIVSMANCTELEVLDLGNNNLNDTFPIWLGTLPELRVLILRSNKFHRPVRASSSTRLFPQLQMIDLSCNAFTAELPTSLFQDLKGMRRIDQTMKAPSDGA